MTPSDAEGRLRIELWVWPDRDAIDDTHDLVLRRLEELREEGIVDELSVEEWSHQINLASDERTDPEDVPAREHVEAFAEWARERGVTLPLPEPTESGTGRMGPEHLTQNLPRMMMAEYRDGELYCVAPHQEGEERYTIEDRLELLAE
jgi:hypothetical protein